MNKYEIMLIVDPSEEINQVNNLVESVFSKNGVKKAEKLENTTLAYPINKSLKAQYLLYAIESESSIISEFIRRCNITKSIWRHLIVNLSTEKGLNKAKKARKIVVNKEARFSKNPGTKQLVENIDKVANKTKFVKKEASKSTSN